MYPGFTQLCGQCRSSYILRRFEKAIAAAAYLVADHERSFILGKSKLAPVSGNTIPRLELCSAVLATELGQFIETHLDYIPKTVKYFTDSKVVLDYIRNKTRRFYTYVSNRVDRIHNSTTPSQWNYVVTSKNPADVGTRYTLGDTADKEQVWLRGYPEHSVPDDDVTEIMDEFPLVCPDSDREIRPCVMKTDVRTRLGCKRFESYSSWKRLVSSIAFWKYCAKRRSFKEPTKRLQTSTISVQQKSPFCKLFRVNAFHRRSITFFVELLCHQAVPFLLFHR